MFLGLAQDSIPGNGPIITDRHEVTLKSLNTSNFGDQDAYTPGGDDAQKTLLPLPLPDSPDTLDTTFNFRGRNDKDWDKYKLDIIPEGLIKVGYCFQHIGKKEQVYNRATILAATTLNNDRFRLPLIPIFIRT